MGNKWKGIKSFKCIRQMNLANISINIYTAEIIISLPSGTLIHS